MKRWAGVAGVLFGVWIDPTAGRAQTPPATPAPEAAAVESATEETERFGNIDGLPSWLRLGIELRGRAEFHLDPEQDLDDRLYLNRLRLNVVVQPARWVRFYVQGQDARAFRLNAGPAFEDQRNTFDVRLGYLELGQSEQGWQVRAGRQELSVGDERLVGADNYWDVFGQSFDAVRLGFAGKRFRISAFTGFRVEPARRWLDILDKKSRISGISAPIQTHGDGVLEPYLLWKRGGDTLDLRERPGHRDVATPGLLARGDLPRGLDYSVEVAIQRGHVVLDRVSAWGGHWEIGWKPLGKDLGPRLGFEYNFASGDNDPADGGHHTFDDLYPAGFNKYGITDPFAWRNIRYPAASIDLPLTRRWTVYGGWRSYWLATIRDGLYPGGDEFLVRNPEATSTHIGSQVFFSAAYSRSERWQVYAGHGHLFPGSFLRQSGCSSALRTVYLLSSFAF